MSEIQRLYLDYIAAVDDDIERWPDVFTDDCSYRIVARENVRRGLPLAVIRCDSRDMLRDRVNAIQSSAFYVQRVHRHLIGLLDVTEETDAMFTVRANFAVYVSLSRAPTALLCAGVYDDVVVRDGDALKFKQKHCIYDGDVVTESLVFPL